MVKIDLITGFLGSGKTTFIKKYAQYLLDRGFNIGILENDFGAVNVDMMMLQELRGDRCELEMISGGCDKETHRRRFRTKLISMGMCGYDRVLVEPSGIYDIDEFFDVLRDEPLDRWYEIGSVITVVDATLNEHLSEASEFLLASETADAGCVFLTRMDLASPETADSVKAHLNRALETNGCKRKLGKEVIAKSWDEMTQTDFEQIMNSGYRTEICRKPDYDVEEVFRSLYFLDLHKTSEELRSIAKCLLSDTACGHIFRIKGFANENEGWTEINAARNEITIRPVQEGQDVLIVIGEHLQKEKIESIIYTTPGLSH